MSAARRHHWIPQFYLRQFANPALRVFVVDFVRRRSFWAASRDVCVERDFNRLDAAQGLPPNALENAPAGFEAEAAPALQEIIAQPGAPSAQAWGICLNLMALLATRNPVTRQHREAEAARQWYAHFEAAAASPERWQEVMDRARAHGHIAPDRSVEFEAASDFIQNRRFTLEFDRSGFFPDEFADQDRVFSELRRRRWRLVGAHEDSPGFITTDRPVCLTRIDGRMPDEPLTFDNPETLIMFPVCPRLLAMGLVDKMTELHEADRRVVRLANKTLMQYCDQRVIAPHEQFEVGGNRFAVGAGILEMVADRVNF